MILTDRQIFDFMHAAGFNPTLSVTMTAIALRESAGDPDAYNGNIATGDRSFGLLQINMLGGLSAPRLKLFGLSDETQLFDPATNARAGFRIYGGKISNLDMAWYIDRPGPYRDRYESHLPAAQAAALESLTALN